MFFQSVYKIPDHNRLYSYNQLISFVGFQVEICPKPWLCLLLNAIKTIYYYPRVLNQKQYTYTFCVCILSLSELSVKSFEESRIKASNPVPFYLLFGQGKGDILDNFKGDEKMSHIPAEERPKNLGWWY